MIESNREQNSFPSLCPQRPLILHQRHGGGTSELQPWSLLPDLVLSGMLHSALRVPPAVGAPSLPVHQSFYEGLLHSQVSCICR